MEKIPVGKFVGNGTALEMPPQRICFARMETHNTPVASFSTPMPYCGMPLRKNPPDALIFDASEVTCEACKAKLANQPEEQPGAEIEKKAHQAGQKTVQSQSVGTDVMALVRSLDSREIEERLAQAEGEVAALKVLYQAALAKEEASRV